MKPPTEKLLNRWIEGELNYDEAKELQTHLLAEPETREAYYDLLVLDHMLGETAEGRGQMTQVVNAPVAPPITHPHGHRYLVPALVGAAALIIGMLAVFFKPQPDLRQAETPVIKGSADSRITIAQREDRQNWKPGELLRIERGTAVIQLNPQMLINVSGPAALELLDAEGSLRVLEGSASFVMDEGKHNIAIHLPGGVITGPAPRFNLEVRSDGTTDIDVDSATLVLSPRKGGTPFSLTEGKRLRLEIDGTFSILGDAPPVNHVLSGEMVLYREDFTSTGLTPLDKRVPVLGCPWQVLEELNPTIIQNGVLDTSSGARRLLAPLVPHQAASNDSVYIFNFQFETPSWIGDKVRRQDGFESISFLDSEKKPVFSLQSTAVSGHRWAIRNEQNQIMSSLTPICSLWPHSLTVCYGLNGSVTLHDGDSAQAPVVASLKLAGSATIDSILFTNRTGGDLAITSMEATLLGGQTTSSK